MLSATGKLETRVEVRHVMLNGYVKLPFKLRPNGCNNSQHCWELSSACWQLCAKGCNNSQQRWDLQCIIGRIQPIRLCKPSVVRVRGPNNVERARVCKGVRSKIVALRFSDHGTKEILGSGVVG